MRSHAKSGAARSRHRNDKGRDGTGNHRRDGRRRQCREQLAQTETNWRESRTCHTVASDITERMEKDAFCAGKGGKADMDTLVGEVEVSVRNSANAADKLETLNQYISEMNTIVELINGVTSQTSLLALNASIEGRLAGEAGKGFAVVASEISDLATQTKSATTNITQLIGNVSGSITEVVTVIREMIDGINEEKNVWECVGKLWYD